MFKKKVKSNFRANLTKRLVFLLSTRFRRKYVQEYPQLAIFAFDYIGYEINVKGRYELNLLEDIRDFLQASAFPFDGCCLDIGANIGNHSVFFSELFSEVISFEPNPKTYELLKFNAYGRNIITHNFGLSDSKSKLPFHQVGLNIGASCIVDNSSSATADFNVDVKRLDSQDEISCKNILLMKIDVEGHEASVLRGAEQTISTHKPLILLEQNQQEFDGGRSESTQILIDMGYKFCLRTPSFNFQRSSVMGSVGKILRFFFGNHIRFVEVSFFEQRTHELILAFHPESHQLLTTPAKK